MNAFGLSALTAKSGLSSLPDDSPTSSLSNTVSISDPGEWLKLDENTVEELSEFGDVARVDISLGAVLRCVLVTYFDVRCAQQLLLHFGSRAESFPPAVHDCRIVSVDMNAFAQKALMGGFSQFGEVANVSMFRGETIVEFYDMRSAQFLLATAGGSAQPWTPDASAAAATAAAMGLHNLSFGDSPMLPALAGSLGAAMAAHSGPGLGAVVTGTSPGGVSPLPAGPLSRPPAPQRVPMSTASVSPAERPAPLPKAAMTRAAAPVEEPLSPASPTAAADSDKPKAQSNRPVRTKVTTKDFSKYDIDPEKIQMGEDKRTTVMVRNLTGPRARKEFLQFLERCGLADRYTFFYMPCKEHRNVPAGFAFLNLVSAHDVHKLFVMVKSGFWREFLSDPQCKAPAMSYARFQGHEELSKHFSSSAVLHEQDPEKRPIFRPEAGKLAAQEAARAEKHAAAAPAPPPAEATHMEAPNWNHIIQGEASLHMALAKGASEIANILMRQVDGSPQTPMPPGINPSASPVAARKSESPAARGNDPAYISIPSISEFAPSKGQGGGMGRLQGIQEDADTPILDSQQMGA
mmetsp:Transcript_25731/g.65471  ORF Transcript_25731/g.65471 Transcript_25731/m.65471 type:complete len:576 (+) Transcript_25731:111-1838(+)